MYTTPRRGALVRVLAPVAALGLLAACGGGDGGGGGGGGGTGGDADIASVSAEDLDGTTLRFARFFGDCEDTTKGVTDVAKATTECETIQILTNAFNAENGKGITVERLGGAQWNTYYDALNAAYAGGEPPDVAVMHGSSITNYAKRNLLLPLDDALSVTKTDLEDAAPAARSAVTYEDKTYGVPFDLHAALVHLNVDLFKQAGLVDGEGKPIMPTSTEEFLAQAEQMKAKTGKNYFGAARVKDGLGVHMWRSLVEQQGGSVLSEDGSKASVDTPEARTALEFMDQVFSKYADPAQTYDAAQASFLGGQTAMLFNGTWVVDQYDKEAPFTYQTADFPTLYEEPAIWADSHTWVVPRQKEADPVKYRAALEFVNYLYDHSGDWAIHTGHLAARTSVLESPEYEQAPQRANYVATGTTNANLVPSTGNWPAVNDTLIKQIDSIWFQGASVDKALADADRQVDQVLAQQ
jgi:multiple sugar transport system substrate-binding protein